MFRSDFSGLVSNSGERPVTVALYEVVDHPERILRDSYGQVIRQDGEVVVIDKGGCGKQLVSTKKIRSFEIEKFLAKFPEWEICE
ncbi:MAG: hypothetical protein NUV91_10435 [Candidatus Omnitrophica bacterium]|nr:hypothetical protein [Candidatus Omnitrophota bacterium]